MKPLLLFLLVILLATAPACAFSQDAPATIKEQAGKCAKALLSGDFETVAIYTHKRVLDLMGGKDAMIEVLKRGSEGMKAKGVAIEDVTIGEPGKTEKIGEWLVALVPQRLVIKIPDGHLEQDSHMMAISEDEGKHWTFVDVNNRANVEQAFPELVGKIELAGKNASGREEGLNEVRPRNLCLFISPRPLIRNTLIHDQAHLIVTPAGHRHAPPRPRVHSFPQAQQSPWSRRGRSP